MIVLACAANEDVSALACDVLSECFSEIVDISTRTTIFVTSISMDSTTGKIPHSGYRKQTKQCTTNCLKIIIITTSMCSLAHLAAHIGALSTTLRLPVPLPVRYASKISGSVDRHCQFGANKLISFEHSEFHCQLYNDANNIDAPHSCKIPMHRSPSRAQPVLFCNVSGRKDWRLVNCISSRHHNIRQLCLHFPHARYIEGCPVLAECCSLTAAGFSYSAISSCRHCRQSWTAW